MIRTWKCLLGTVAVCALLAGESRAQEIRSDQIGVAHVRTDPNETESADSLYGDQESVWLNDFQPPRGIGVDPVTIPQDNSVGYAVTSNVDTILYRINRTSGNYYGLNSGFTTIQAFVPLRVMNGGTSLLAINPRVFVNDVGRGGVNLGLTARRYFEDTDRVLATSLWLDYDNAHRSGNGYTQLGLYGSIIGRYLTTTAYANIAMGSKEYPFSRSLTSRYVGDVLALTERSLVESPYSHLQFEVATPIPYLSRFGFQYGLGVYGLVSRASQVQDGFGVSNRIQAQVTEDFTVNALITSDGVFGSNVSVNMQLTLPNGMPSRILRTLPVRSQLTASDNRSYRVLTGISHRVRNFAAINPRDGQAYTIAHIDPNVSGNGSGVNDPFGSVLQFDSLPDALQASYDVIVVRGRNDNTDTNLNTTITLFDGQQIFGTGGTEFIETTRGLVQLPDLPYGTPMLSNSGAPMLDVVRLADGNVVSGLNIDAGYTAMGINGLDAGDNGVRDFRITNNLIRHATVGINIDVDDTISGTGEHMTGVIDNNTVELTTDDGVRITFDGTGAFTDVLDLTVTNNTFQGTLGQAIDVNLTGTAVASLNISDNELFLLQQGQFITGANFTGSSMNDTNFPVIPPDTMGGVGPDHVVEMINNAFAIYDKDGNLISRSTLDQFWAQIVPGANGTFDSRIIYDPTTSRWFAVAIDGAVPTNNVYLAVSETSDPTGAWNGLSFPADSQGQRFYDFDTFGMDADGVYISTNNFGGPPTGFDNSIFSIPKADLLGPTPTVANMTRFENLSTALTGNSIQPVVDFGPSDGTELLATSSFSLTDLVRTNLSNTNTANATFSAPVNVPVPLYIPGPLGRQPNPLVPPLDNVSPRFNSNAVKVGNDIWAVHTVQGTGVIPNSAVRWYEIDATTNAVVQTGLIEDPNVDYLDASIAVNDNGQVAIGFTGTGPNQAPSTMAVMGSTTGGVTTFGTPTILKQGFGDYFVDFGSGRNRWGDYSATVVDPSGRNGNHFWTFQEYVPTANQWAVQITELIGGLGGNDGIAIHAGDNAEILAGSEISRNNIMGGTGTGLSVVADGNAIVNLFPSVSDNTITGMQTDGMFFSTADAAVMTVDGDRNVVNNNGRIGLFVQTDGTSSADVQFRNSIFDGNAERGIKGSSYGSSSLTFSLTSPFDPLATEDRNHNGILDPQEDLNGNGGLDVLPSSASGNMNVGARFLADDFSTQSIYIDHVVFDGNANAGLVGLASGHGTSNIVVTNSSFINGTNAPDPDLNGEGIEFATSGFGTLGGLIMDNSIHDNVGSGVLALATENSVLDLHTSAADMAAGITQGIIGNQITDNGAFGIRIQRRYSADVEVDITDNIVNRNDTGLSVFTDGGNVDSIPATRIHVLRGDFSDNTNNGMQFESFGSSVLLADAIGSTVTGNGGSGVVVTSNEGSFIGMPDPAGVGIGSPSVFDSLQVTDNGDAGFLLTNNDLSTLVIDITSIEAAMYPNLYDRTLISRNFDGIRINHNGGSIVGDFALSSIRVGTAFAFPDPKVFEVEVTENSDDAIDVNINPGSAGVFNLNVSDTLLRGGRTLGINSDPGISITHDSSFTVATIVVGADIADAAGPYGLPRGPNRDPVGGVFNNIPYARAGDIITDFAGDGINVVYNNSDSTGSQLNLRLFDSIIGQSAFGFNTGDGLDITVDNAGGFDGIVDNTQIIGNGGNGIAMRTTADPGGLFADPANSLDGSVEDLGPAMQSDSNNPPNGIGDTIADAPVGGANDTTSRDYLDSLPYVLNPAGNNNGWADLTSPDDFVADLQIINGSRVDFNGLDGVHLDIGTATRQRVSLQNSSFSGNGNFELNIQTFASFEPNNRDIDRGEGMVDRVVLDPTAKLDIYFGSLNMVRNTAPGFPMPGPLPVPAEFAAAIGGEGFNTSDSTRVLVDYQSTTANGFQVASTFKGAPRPANLFIRALIPNDPIVDDIDTPLPNRFLNFGQPFDETLFFTGNLPPAQTPSGRYLDLNTP